MLPCKVGEAAGQIGGRNPARTRVNAEPIEQVDDVRGEADADGHVADGVFENQIPADDPRDEFAHGGVGVGVGAAGDGNHGGEFGITDRSESADDGDEDEGQGDRRAGAGAAEGGGMVDQIFEQRAR